MNTQIYIIKEIKYDKSPIFLHEVIVSKYKDFISLDSFRNGSRKFCSVKDRKCFRMLCTFGPTSLFYIKTYNDWLNEDVQNVFVMCQLLKQTPLTFINEHYVNTLTVDNLDLIPRKIHQSIWDFYKSIGFDTKTRSYRTEQNLPIKYCTVTIGF